MDDDQPSPESRVAALETAEEARRLLVVYGRCCDRHDADELANVFADDVVLTAGATPARWEGLEAVTEFYRGAFADREAQRHFISNVAVTGVDPRSATIDAYFVVTRSSKGTSMLGWGSYRVTCERTAGRLQVASLHIDLDWLGDVHDGWVVALDSAMRVPEL